MHGEPFWLVHSLSSTGLRVTVWLPTRAKNGLMKGNQISRKEQRQTVL